MFSLVPPPPARPCRHSHVASHCCKLSSTEMSPPATSLNLPAALPTEHFSRSNLIHHQHFILIILQLFSPNMPQLAGLAGGSLNKDICPGRHAASCDLIMFLVSSDGCFYQNRSRASEPLVKIAGEQRAMRQ